MKLIASLLLFSTVSAWAKPLVLVSYYDKFGKAPFNNSERIARGLEASLNSPSSPVNIRLCALETKFDVAYAQLEKCLQNSAERPAMIVGLGETGCNVKVELIGRNLDKSLGPDNAGVNRRNTVIIPEAPAQLGLTFPIDEMYCALDTKDRGNVFVSNNAGSFVCNNTAFQLSHYYPEIPNGFIHVPSNNCKNLPQLNADAIRKLTLMIGKVASLELTAERLPVSKEAVNAKRAEWKGRDACRSEFWGKARGIDEKKRQ